MQAETVVLRGSGLTERDFVVYGRSRPEFFSARLMDGSDTLQVTWIETLGIGTIVNRLAQVQALAGGPGSFRRITGQASDNLQTLLEIGQFSPQLAAQALSQRLGGQWQVDITPHPHSLSWDMTATRVGD
jgi:hypothetical protein